MSRCSCSILKTKRGPRVIERLDSLARHATIMSEINDLREFVAKLASDVIRSKRFHAREEVDDKLTQALQQFANAYGDPGVLQISERMPTGIKHRLKKQLRTCFKTDHRFWRSRDQYILSLSRSGGLELRRLSDVVEDAPTRFWLHQSARFDPERTFITISEPLFFFSNTLNAYLRLLDINEDDQVAGKETEIAATARNRIERQLRAAGVVAQSADDLMKAIDLVPVRHYLPAGESLGASEIRGWFRKTLGSPPKRREASRGSEFDRSASNLIILASRDSDPDLRYFRRRVPDLRLDLTENGIRWDNKEMRDEISPTGARITRVVVTNWLFDDDNAFTVIASNHTRALGRVCALLVGNEMDPRWLVDSDGIVPTKIQMVFEVQLNIHESLANAPRLLGDPIIYP